MNAVCKSRWTTSHISAQRPWGGRSVCNARTKSDGYQSHCTDWDSRIPKGNFVEYHIDVKVQLCPLLGGNKPLEFRVVLHFHNVSEELISFFRRKSFTFPVFKTACCSIRQIEEIESSNGCLRSEQASTWSQEQVIPLFVFLCIAILRIQLPEAMPDDFSLRQGRLEIIAIQPAKGAAF